jgi:uncharacterized phage infection (PIP) family protein YhgE
MPVSVAVLRKLEEVEPQLRGVLISILEELERQREETVTKNDFNGLNETVRELAIAQQRTENALIDLKQVVSESAIRTDARFSELAAAQRETGQRLGELSAKTDERFGELATAQRELKQSLKELADAQKKTEKALQDLTKDHSKTKEQLGGLSHTFGYVLENEAYKFLPALLKSEFDLDVKGRLLRDFVKDNRGHEIEVNILGQATRKRNRFVIVGESKSQLSKNKVSEFLNKKLKRLDGVFDGELFPILVTHMKSEPDVDAFAEQKGIKRVYYSYEFSA